MLLKLHDLMNSIKNLSSYNNQFKTYNLNSSNREYIGIKTHQLLDRKKNRSKKLDTYKNASNVQSHKTNLQEQPQKKRK